MCKKARVVIPPNLIIYIYIYIYILLVLRELCATTKAKVKIEFEHFSTKSLIIWETFVPKYLDLILEIGTLKLPCVET